MSSLAVRTASEPGNAGQDKSSTVKMNGVRETVSADCIIYYKGAETGRRRCVREGPALASPY